MIDIYIPSYNRPDAPLIRKFADAGIPFTIVIDHKEDIEPYEKWEGTSAHLLYIEGGGKGIGYIRQKVKDLYNGTPVMMMDDDTTLALRDFENPTKLITCKSREQIREWVDVMDKFCSRNKFDIGSAADSVWKWKNTERTLKNGSLCSVTIFNSWRCKEIDYDPRLYKRMEDHDLILQAITKHFKFLICNEVLRHCPMNKAGKDVGGCSCVYRDDKAMFATTTYITEKWGRDIVKCSDTKKIGNYCDFTIDYKKVRKICGYDY